MAGWVQDTLYGTRMLIKRPGTTGIAVVALALGIGLTTTMFSIVQGAILRGSAASSSRSGWRRCSWRAPVSMA